MKRQPQEPDGRATLRDIADRIGVHVSTVSRALNPMTRELVADELVARIVDVARELQYRPVRVAAPPPSPTSMTIAVVLSDIANVIFPGLVQSIEATLALKNYATLVAHAETGYPHESPLVEQMAARQVDGLILTTSRRHTELIDFCLESDVPLVTVHRFEGDPRISSIINDDRGSMALAVQHLVDLGHQRIAHLGGPPDMYSGAERREGSEQAMRRCRLEPATIVRTKAYSREEGQAAAARIFAAQPDVTAIATANDILAVGCLDVLKSQGRRCPRDVSIVGHSDMPLMDMIDPPLTTVRINVRQLGTEAANLMLRRLEDPTSDSMKITLHSRLVDRGSTAPPPA